MRFYGNQGEHFTHGKKVSFIFSCCACFVSARIFRQFSTEQRQFSEHIADDDADADDNEGKIPDLKISKSQKNESGSLVFDTYRSR